MNVRDSRPWVIPLSRCGRLSRALLVTGLMVLAACALADEKPLELTVSVRPTGANCWQLVTLDVTGKGRRVLLEEPQELNFPAWSPDGRYIAYLHFDNPLDQALEVGQLMLYDTETLVHRRLGADDLRCHGSWPAWRPSGE